MLNLKEYRERLGLTQTELAEKMHVTIRTIQLWEKNGCLPSSQKSLITSIFNETDKDQATPETAVHQGTETLCKILEELTGMRKLLEDQLCRKDDQIDKLLGILSSSQK